MAAATEWLNALAAGASVTSVRRREPRAAAAEPPAAAVLEARARGVPPQPARGAGSTLQELSAPSYPPGRPWDEPLAAANGRFRVVATHDAADDVEQVICATGFKRGFRHDPVLAGLVAEHGPRDRRATGSSSTPTAPFRRSPAPGRTLGARRGARAVGVSRRRYAGGDAVRRPPIPRSMSYTLRGRLESRLAAMLAPAGWLLRSRRSRSTTGGRSSSRR